MTAAERIATQEKIRRLKLACDRVALTFSAAVAAFAVALILGYDVDFILFLTLVTMVMLLGLATQRAHRLRMTILQSQDDP